MPLPSQQNSKRPNILAWIGYGLAVILGVWLVVAIFTNVWSSSTTSQKVVTADAGAPSLKTMMLGRGVTPSVGMMAPQLAEDVAIAPMPRIIPAPGGGTPVDDLGNAIKPRVIKTGNLSLRIADITRTMDDVRGVVGGRDGFVESSSVSDSGEGPRSGYVTVRVPADKFDETMTALKRIAQVVLNESVNGQDITMEYVDLEAQLRNAKAEEQSYLEIMKRATKIEDILAVTQQLSQVRGQIEQLQGRQRYLSNKTDLATISVSLTEETRIEVPSRTWKPFEVLKQTLGELVTSLQGLVDLSIRVAIGLIGLVLPVVVVTGVVVWIGWKIVKAILRRTGR